MSKWIARIFGYKMIFQIVYLIFTLMIIKKLEVVEYGLYSYVTAIVVYFASVPLLGLPLYLQRNIARKNIINFNYFIAIFIVLILSFGIAYHIMSELTFYQKFCVLLIIAINVIYAVLSAIHNGFENYIFQYRMLFFTNLWIIFCLVQTIVFHKQMTFERILNYWVCNVLILAPIFTVKILKLAQLPIKISRHMKISSALIVSELILLYGVNISGNFVKFYDRYLAMKFLDKSFLGYYSFNLMSVTILYGLFILPIQNILTTKLSQSEHSHESLMRLVVKFYLYGLLIYLSYFIFYTMIADKILILFGLSKYLGTKYIFYICILNAVLYFLSIPFTSMIALGDNGKKKMLYCVLSILIFCLPYLFVFLHPTENFFFAGFVLAYLMNLVLCLSMESHKAYVWMVSMSKNLKKIHFMRYRYYFDK